MSNQPPSPPPPSEAVYLRDPDLEDFENYRPGGFHPASIGDEFKDGRYRVMHKLGFGGYSTIWLARDLHRDRYVALKLQTARQSLQNKESAILRSLHDQGGVSGARFIPSLLDEFTVTGPNGTHSCLVSKPLGPNVAISKEDAPNWMFPAESARSIAAQLILGLSYLHSRGLCHGDLHMRNFLLKLRTPGLHDLDSDQVYQRFGPPSAVPVKRKDGASVAPYAPMQAVYPMSVNMPADEVIDPEVVISDYGTSFFVAQEKTPKLHTFPHYRPPEDFFGEPVTLAADVWTLGVNLYEVMGERPLFEVFGWDSDDIIGEMVSSLGRLPDRWWRKWWKGPDSAMTDPLGRPLQQRLWDMGRGETPETCIWDVAGGEMRALEDMFRGMLAYEPSERWTAEQLMRSEYMTRWAMPAWEEQRSRTTAKAE